MILQLDTDRDGHLSIHEIKTFIRNRQCRNLPENLANQIVQMNDNDANGLLDFEEFYRMSIKQEWLINRLLTKYCKLVVPPPRRLEEDEIGKSFLFLSFYFVLFLFVVNNDFH